MQLKEFGFDFKKGDGFSIRYRHHERFGGLWKSIFIPFGPIAESKKGFDNFVSYVINQRYNKITLPLPLILDTGIMKHVKQTLESYGFKNTSYTVHEDETLLTIKGEFSPSSKTRYKIRRCYKNCKVVVTHKPSERQLRDAYSIYHRTAERIGYEPRGYKIFKRLSQSCLLGLAYKKTSKELVGFIFGFILKIYVRGFLKGKERVNIIQIMFSGVSKQGRKLFAGYGLRDSLIQEAFENQDITIVDSLGASRKWNEPYLPFKKEFATKFVSLPGNFVRVKLLR